MTNRELQGTIYQNREEALAAFKSAFRSEDPEQLIAIYGEQGRALVVSGDPTADKAFMKGISRRLEQRAELLAVVNPKYPKEQWYKIRFGVEGWNMQIPLVNRGEGWLFATEYAEDAAKEFRREMNEVFASDTLFLLVSAQREYFKQDRDNDGVREYAQKIISSPGSHDGLYWEESTPGEAPSPLNSPVAKAIRDGYTAGGKAGSYHGYRYKILLGEARKAGGTQSYLAQGQMTRGFAMVAYPTNWNISGAKTFVIQADGRMFKKDMGFKTAALGDAMEELDLDATWVRVEHPELGLRLSRDRVQR